MRALYGAQASKFKGSDTTLIMLLRSTDSTVWNARFTQAVQPSLVKVAVELKRTP